jgi:hypothetical protein
MRLAESGTAMIHSSRYVPASKSEFDDWRVIRYTFRTCSSN